MSVGEIWAWSRQELLWNTRWSFRLFACNWLTSFLIGYCALLMNFNSKALMQIVSKYSTYATTKKVLEPLRGKRPEFYKWIERFTNRKMKKKKLSNHRNDTICQSYLKLPNRYICRYLNITIKDRPEAPLMLNTPEVPWKKDN